MKTGLAGYRKAIAVVVTALLMFGLNRFGITADALAAMGLHVVDIQLAITELILQVSVPAVFQTSQPNEPGQSLWRDWWHWILIGLGGVAVAIGVIALL